MITINTNVNNLKLQRNLNSVNSAMQNALNRISTGYRINNASDDAAGLVISKALDVQNRGLDVANQNAQMATNLLSVADGALGQMGELTMRIRDLATQSANGGYSDSEREALNLEAKELTNNLEQLVKGTKFNDYNIFTQPKKGGITTEAEAINQGYEIVKTAEELKAALTAPDAINNSNKKVMLFEDINLDDLGIVDGNNWAAVGKDPANYFKGTFDGNGYTISNLKINKSTVDFQGFFGCTYGARIKNTSLENVDVKGKNHTGGLVGSFYSSSTVQNSYSTGNVVGGVEHTGGLIGSLYGASTVLNSYSTSNVVGTNYVGGVVGALYTSSSIQNSYSVGDVTGNNFTGGIVGHLYLSSIQNSYSEGNVTGGDYIGGLVGNSTSSTIQNTYSACNVTGTNYTGGLVGGMTNSDASIKNSYSTGNIFSSNSATSTSSFGGLIGYINNKASISNSYSTGQNKAAVGNRGGFVGQITLGATLAINNYAYATQNAGGAANGNGIGVNKGTISGTEQTSGQNPDWFAQTSNVGGVIGAGSTSWDFSGTSPVLKWQIKPAPENNVTFQIGTDGSALSAISMDLGFGLGNFKPDIFSVTNSRKTMEMCDVLLKAISSKSGEIGANTNIISSIVDGNTITNENLTASKSRIQDADIAKESAIMVKNHILEQTTTSLLLQSSNISGQLALQLLSGLGGRR